LQRTLFLFYKDVVYLFCKSVKTTARLDFEECVKTYFAEKIEDTTKPRILFSFYYSHLDSNDRIESNMNTDSNIPINLHVVGGSKVELDFDFHVTQAEKVFHSICPSEVFLPKPPEQEDIIFDSKEITPVNEMESDKVLDTNEVNIEKKEVNDKNDDQKE